MLLKKILPYGEVRIEIQKADTMVVSVDEGCVFLGEHSSSSELLNRSRQQPKIIGARDILQNPCATGLGPNFCKGLSKEGVFMHSNELKRSGATWSSRNQWETHQRRVERLNERRQLHDASILREIGVGATVAAAAPAEDYNTDSDCLGSMLTNAVMPTW